MGYLYSPKALFCFFYYFCACLLFHFFVAFCCFIWFVGIIRNWIIDRGHRDFIEMGIGFLSGQCFKSIDFCKSNQRYSFLKKYYAFVCIRSFASTFLLFACCLLYKIIIYNQLYSYIVR